MIAQTLNFTYSFVQPRDCKWGLEVNGVWEGMIGQLVRQEVDLVIADLAATDNKFWPKKESLRILVAFFWIFCVVLSAAYVGNLTAKLAETKENKAFNSLEELR
ncbi:glutamate receptor U1-like [Patella vulgata]|uniref:glutamate receptor U1-like n=1 Tax=Patella vulgata TaxID=6465 RepID=UPI00217F2E41|nr:glutamate receptor U1-like [Patella vulgata]